MARQKPLEFYGLPQLGYAEAIPLSGEHRRDQLAIERFCFRIGHDEREGGLGKFGHFRNFIDLIYNQDGSRKPFLWHQWSDWVTEKCCKELEVGEAGSASAGKTAPAALWAVGNFLADPTHTKVFCFSTTIKEANDRIWKEVIEYWQAAPQAEGKIGKLVQSQNKILGLNTSGQGFGNTSGIYLYAADKSNESTAFNGLIGSKVPKTGTPTEDADILLRNPEFADLAHMGFEEDHLRDLVLRLQEVSLDRRGRIIIIIDEATGVSGKLLDAYFTNLKPGNEGRVQIIVIGNPSSRMDTHGRFCKPANGYESINPNMTEWRTATGGVCLHFDGRKNPRIVHGDERLVWMPTQKANDELAENFGENSYEFFRMVAGFWAPEGAHDTIYSEADLVSSGAMSEEPVKWGYHPPKMICGFDPAFTSGGDRSVATFAKLGVDAAGQQVLEYVEAVSIKPDITKRDVPVAEQILVQWKHECEKRNVPPDHCCFDASGGGVSFAALVHRMWSPRVRSVTSGGKASERPLSNEKGPDGKPIRGCDKYANRATALWCVNVPFLRTGQIKRLPDTLVKELCSRQKAKKKGVTNLDKIQIERKQDYKARERQSPDDSDSWNLTCDEAITRHGFRVGEPRTPEGQPVRRSIEDSPWEQLKARARRITNRKRLKRH